MSSTRLIIVPVSFRAACEFVLAWHRHTEPPQGHKFSLGVATDDRVLRGVAIVGRPIVPSYDNGSTLEVRRTTTDGTPNANSALYGASWRAAKALGYVRLITYTLASEPGTSLRASGWWIVAERKPRGGWDHPSRPRHDVHQTGVARTLWEVAL